MDLLNDETLNCHGTISDVSLMGCRIGRQAPSEQDMRVSLRLYPAHRNT